MSEREKRDRMGGVNCREADRHIGRENEARSHTHAGQYSSVQEHGRVTDNGMGRRDRKGRREGKEVRIAYRADRAG